MVHYYKLVNTFNGILQKLWVFLIIFVTLFSLPILAMEKTTGETEKKSEINIPPSFVNTLTTLARMAEGLQAVLSPPTDIPNVSDATKIPSPLAYQQASTIITNRNSSTSLLARASEFVDGTTSDYPSLKTTDFHTMMESMVLSGMKERPQHFSSIATGEPVLPDTPYEIGFKFLQEFTEEGALDIWMSHLQQTIEAKGAEEPDDTNQASMEFLNSAANVLRWLGSNAVNDPLRDPLNKHVSPEDFKEVIELETWLEQNPGHVKYDAIQKRFKKLNKRIKRQREQAMKDGANHMFSLLKRMNPNLAHMEKMSEVTDHHKKQWDIEKRKEFEAYVLEKYGKSNLFEPNRLRSFWQTVEGQQYGKVCYKIVCESFEVQHHNSPLHQTVQQIWLASQLDTMNEHPKEARSRMPGTSFDGMSAPNFGYAMGRSDAYQKWIENPLARASGDIIMEAYHSIVDFGRTLDIEVFLGRLRIHLSGEEEDRTDYYKNPHEYDKFMIPFELYLLERVFQTPFVSGNGKKITDELRKTAGRDLFDQAFNHLNELKKFSDNMFILRPSKDEQDGNVRANGLVFGIGFNGELFDSPNTYQKNDNEIWLTFSNSGRNPGGHLLLFFIKHAAKSHSSCITSGLFCSNLGENFNRYKTLIRRHLRNEIKNLYYVPNSQWDSHMRDYMEKKRAKFEGFMAQLEAGIPYGQLAQQFKIWIMQASNWYSIPSEVEIQIPFEMPFEEYPAQFAARKLLLDALTGRPFLNEYENLMPHLFLHWKDEVLNEISKDKCPIIQEAKKLSDIAPEELRNEVLTVLNKFIMQVHPQLKLVWQLEIDEQFKKYIQPREKEANTKLVTARLSIKNIGKSLHGLEKSKSDVSKKIEENQKSLASAKDEKANAEREIDAMPNDVSQLSREEYEVFRNLFFNKRDVSQCVEPVFSRVLGHDRFFSVFISNEPATAPIIIGDPNSPDFQRLQLGNRILQDVIAPCNNRCQYHALGHLYTGDMMLHQSADHLDGMRSIHGLGNVPDQFMSFDNIRNHFF